MPPQQGARSDGQAAPTGPASAATHQSSSANRQKIAEARRKFNDGKLAEAEKLALECIKPGTRNRMFGDSAEKLLEEIKACKTQDAAWKKDSSSTVTKRSRSNFLVMRARILMEEGDFTNADRILREAERIQVQRGRGDLKPEYMRQQLARKAESRQKAIEAQEILTAQARAKAQAQRNEIENLLIDGRFAGRTTCRCDHRRHRRTRPAKIKSRGSQELKFLTTKRPAFQP